MIKHGVGDIVRFTREGAVDCVDNRRTMINGIVFGHDEGSFEIIARASEPETDPIGTVRISSGGRLVVKTTASRNPWKTLANPTQGVELHGNDHGSVESWPILGYASGLGRDVA